MRHGKRYRSDRALFDRERLYSPVEAIRLLKSMDGVRFDETVEVHFRLGLNVRHADEQLRGTLMLPHGTGKAVRVAVFAEGDKAREAEDAGADVVGSTDLAKQIEEGFTEFDVAIATPVAPTGCPLAIKPPEVLMAHSPSGAALPSPQYAAPLPGSALPITSVPIAPITVKQSCTSATLTSPGFTPAIS